MPFQSAAYVLDRDSLSLRGSSSAPFPLSLSVSLSLFLSAPCLNPAACLAFGVIYTGTTRHYKKDEWNKKGGRQHCRKSLVASDCGGRKLLPWRHSWIELFCLAERVIAHQSELWGCRLHAALGAVSINIIFPFFLRPRENL